MTDDRTSHQTWMALPETDRTSWNNFRRAAVGVIAKADADLQEHVALGYVDFDALITLSIAPERTMRMAELARAVSRSPSALTRLVCRLEDRGLVARNRRSPTEVTVTITDDGLTLLDEAVPRHLALIDQQFWAPLTPNQRVTLGALSARLLDVDAPDC